MPRDARPLLEVEEVTVQYGRGSSGHTALRAVTVSVERGEAVGIIGETGSGKSTLARAVVGLVSPSVGRIFVHGEDTTAFSRAGRRAFRRKGIVQYVFQDSLRSLDPDVTIATSIAEPLLIRGCAPRAAEAQVLGCMARTGLDASLADRLPRELSGGQRQRVALARALIGQPELLLLDEPVSALDAASRVQMLDLLAGLRASGTTLLFISHDLGSVAGLTDRLVVLFRGAIVEAGPTREIVTQPRHPYTRLLVNSAPTLTGSGVTEERRSALRLELESRGSELP
jgi:ABC-type glutathione transport system ATPase component